MADQQDLQRIVTAQAAQLDKYEAAQAHSAVASGIADAIRETGVPLRPALEQLVAVLGPSVTLTGGRVTGPSATPIGEFVRTALGRPTFAHFRADEAVAHRPERQGDSTRRESRHRCLAMFCRRPGGKPGDGGGHRPADRSLGSLRLAAACNAADLTIH